MFYQIDVADNSIDTTPAGSSLVSGNFSDTDDREPALQPHGLGLGASVDSTNIIDPGNLTDTGSANVSNTHIDVELTDSTEHSATTQAVARPDLGTIPSISAARTRASNRSTCRMYTLVSRCRRVPSRSPR